MIWLVINLLIEQQKFPKKSPWNNSEKVTNENYKEIPEEKYVSPEKRQKIID